MCPAGIPLALRDSLTGCSNPVPPPSWSLFQVSTPLALNIYTAVHNPISVKGRLQLCKGALAHVDTRPVLSEIDIPVICIQSTQNNFVKPLHTDPYVSRRGGEVRSIHKARCPSVLRLYGYLLVRGERRWSAPRPQPHAVAVVLRSDNVEAYIRGTALENGRSNSAPIARCIARFKICAPLDRKYFVLTRVGNESMVYVANTKHASATS